MRQRETLTISRPVVTDNDDGHVIDAGGEAIYLLYQGWI